MDLTRAQVATLALLCACTGELEALQAGLTGDRGARIEAVLARFRPEPSGDGR